MCTKYSFEGRRATGVALESGETYSAGREVILSAGTIATPKILQLSGIGDAAHLRGHGIDVVADLPGVGENYQDHLEGTVQAEISDPLDAWPGQGPDRREAHASVHADQDRGF